MPENNACSDCEDGDIIYLLQKQYRGVYIAPDKIKIQLWIDIRNEDQDWKREALKFVF